MLPQLAQLASKACVVYEVELTKLRSDLSKGLDHLKSTLSERDDLLSFKLSYEGLFKKVATIRGPLMRLEKAYKKLKIL